MIKILGWIIACGALPAAAVETKPTDSIYVVADNDAENAGRQVAFSKERRIFVKYHGKDVSRPYWGSEEGGLYQETVRRGIRFDLGTEFSIPQDIDKRRSWTINEWSCNAAKAANLWKVYCRILDPNSNRTRKFMAYDYTKDRGVIGLTMSCSRANLCWYALAFGQGILKSE